VDTVEDQKAFAQKHKLSYPLIADSDAEIAKAYGVYKEDWQLAGRATAVIGEDGRVLKTYPKAPLSGEGHAEQVYKDLEELLG
jgi:thioredoxin-dependent peroxiredoxin